MDLKAKTAPQFVAPIPVLTMASASLEAGANATLGTSLGRSKIAQSAIAICALKASATTARASARMGSEAWRATTSHAPKIARRMGAAKLMELATVTRATLAQTAKRRSVPRKPHTLEICSFALVMDFALTRWTASATRDGRAGNAIFPCAPTIAQTAVFVRKEFAIARLDLLVLIVAKTCAPASARSTGCAKVGSVFAIWGGVVTVALRRSVPKHATGTVFAKRVWGAFATTAGPVLIARRSRANQTVLPTASATTGRVAVPRVGLGQIVRRSCAPRIVMRMAFAILTRARVSASKAGAELNAASNSTTRTRFVPPSAPTNVSTTAAFDSRAMEFKMGVCAT